MSAQRTSTAHAPAGGIGRPEADAILGIDPGLRITGYACLDATPVGLRVREAGAIRLQTSASIADRLVELERDLLDLLDRLRPATVAVEKLYAHYKHPTTAIAMGHARGVIFLCARRAGLSLVELGATEVKKSITGFGHASKAQIRDAVTAQLMLSAPPEPADVTDAIAIASCCAVRRGAKF